MAFFSCPAILRLRGKAFSTLVLAEHDGKQLTKKSLSALTAALQMEQGNTQVLVAGEDCAEAARMAAGIKGVGKVLHVEDKALRFMRPDLAYKLLRHLREKDPFDYVVGSDSCCMLDVLPACAKKLNGYYEYSVSKFDKKQLDGDVSEYLNDVYEEKFKKDMENDWIPTKDLITRDMVTKQANHMIRVISIDTESFEPANSSSSLHDTTAKDVLKKVESPFDHQEQFNRQWFSSEWNGWLMAYTGVAIFWYGGYFNWFGANQP